MKLQWKREGVEEVEDERRVFMRSTNNIEHMHRLVSFSKRYLVQEETAKRDTESELEDLEEFGA